MTRLLSLLAFSMAVALNSAHAQHLEKLVDDYRTVYREGRSSHAVDIDNDTLLLNRKDGFYSSGLRYAYKSSVSMAHAVRSAGWRIGQDLYTASDIKLPAAQVGPPNRPYAGWLYAGAFHVVHRADGTHTRVGIDIGCLGPCAGGDATQTQFHRILRQPLPQGWSRQVRNELGVILYADMAPTRWQPGQFIDLTPSFNGRFGNIFTDIGASLTARAGRLNALPDRPAFYGFVRAEAQAVGYNATLQGGYFSSDNPHTVAPKRFVGEAEIGVAWGDGPYALRVGLIRRSNEIRALPNSIGAQNFVRLQFVYAP